MHAALLHTSLQQLVHDLDAAVRSSVPGAPTVAAVETALQPHLGRDDLLTPDQRVGDPSRYRQHLLHVAEDGAFSVVALVWLPGQATPIHDHLAWCVVGVHQGAEYETRYRLVGDRLMTDGTATAHVGDVAGLLPPGDIHKVENAGSGLAVSLHVYGADLRASGSSIRRRYDLPVD
ncbi:MAG TPA: cysteine dioxygenase family protein [Nocardioides sp.]|nr:cysteine dioxygenase family protein [Nocardioides sp.]